MPTGGRPEFAALAIRCFLAQDYAATELIVVDDGDRPLDPALVSDPRVRLLTIPGRATTGAKRNLACREARGEIIIQWDDDDWHGPQRIRRQIEPLLGGRADITALCGPVILDLPRFEFWQPASAGDRSSAFAEGHYGTLAYHRGVVDRWTCYPDCSQGEDAAFLLPALAAGCRLEGVPAAHDFVYVRHGGNATEMTDDWIRRGNALTAPPAALVAELPSYHRLQSLDFGAPRPPQLPLHFASAAAAGTQGLIRPPQHAIGIGVHRSGWSHAFAALQRLDLPLVLDDFVEQTFCYAYAPAVHTQPWVGIFHCPPSMPPFAPRIQHPQFYMGMPEFKASRKMLRGAIALSTYLGEWLQDRLQVPVLTVKHPTEPGPAWSPAALTSGAPWNLLQVGFYLRNTQAIEQVSPSSRYQRSRLLPSQAREGIQDWEGRVALHWCRLATRRSWPGVVSIPCASNAEYDVLLSEAVVLTEVFDASANNVIVECIARGTPLVVNRHPAVVEYVGEDYPLLFDAIEDVPRLLEDDRRILAAHDCLLNRRGEWMIAEFFAQQVGRFCHQVAQVS